MTCFPLDRRGFAAGFFWHGRAKKSVVGGNHQRGAGVQNSVRTFSFVATIAFLCPAMPAKIHWPKADFVLRSLHKLPIPTKTPALAIVPLSGKMRTAEGRRSTEGAQYPSQGQRPWNRGFQLRRSRNAAK
jgi:hypothetical protein